MGQVLTNARSEGWNHVLEERFETRVKFTTFFVAPSQVRGLEDELGVGHDTMRAM